MSLLSPMVSLPACSESAGNSDEGPDTAVDGVPACQESRTAIDSQDDVVSDLGFSAADVLAFAEAEHQSVIRWLPTQPIAYGPETGDVPLVVDVRYAGGPIDLVLSVPTELVGDRVPLPGTLCFDALAIEVEVEVATTGGALAEQFTTEMRARTVEAATIERTLDLDAIGGTFEITSVDGWDPDREATSSELSQPELWIELTEAGTRGHMKTLLIERYGAGDTGVAIGGAVDIAQWPAEEE